MRITSLAGVVGVLFLSMLFIGMVTHFSRYNKEGRNSAQISTWNAKKLEDFSITSEEELEGGDELMINEGEGGDLITGLPSIAEICEPPAATHRCDSNKLIKDSDVKELIIHPEQLKTLNGAFCVTYVFPPDRNVTLSLINPPNQDPVNRIKFFRGIHAKDTSHQVDAAPMFKNIRREPRLFRVNRLRDTLLKNFRESYHQIANKWLTYYNTTTQRMTAKPPLYERTDYVPYVIAIRDAFINKRGQVTDCDAIRYDPIPRGCGGTNADYEGETEVNEVFILTIPNGEEVYHTLIESIPRMAFFIDYIVKHEIPVIAARFHSFLHFLGIKKVYYSNMGIFAKKAYLPIPGSCGNVNTLNLLKWRETLRTKLDEHFGPSSSKIDEKSILVVKRDTKRRPLANHQQLWQALTSQFTEEKLVVYSGENIQTAIEDQLLAFRDAKIIVAPHGAALSHMVVCERGTVLIEILSEGKPINMLFMEMAAQLGLIYYPLPTTTTTTHSDSPLGVVVEDVVTIIHMELHKAKKRKEKKKKIQIK